MTEDAEGGVSQAQSNLSMAQVDVQMLQTWLAQSPTETAAVRLETIRQTQFLSVLGQPVVQDEPSDPRASEDTTVAILVSTRI